MYSKSTFNATKSPQRRYFIATDGPLPAVKFGLFALSKRNQKRYYADYYSENSIPENGELFVSDAPPKLEKPPKILKLKVLPNEPPPLSPVDNRQGFVCERVPTPPSPSPFWPEFSSDASRTPSPTESSVSSKSSTSCPSLVVLVPPRRKPFTPEELQSMKRFKGEKQVSLRGKYDVLVYSIPDTEDAYVFCHDRTNVHYEVYQCIHCWEFKRKTQILVIGDEFLEDPCKLDHVCLGTNKLEDRLERLTHKWLTQLREESKFCKSSPKEEYGNFLKWLKDESDEDPKIRKELLKIFKRSGGYSEHRKLFSRFCKPKKTTPKSFIEKYIPQLGKGKSEESEEQYFELDESFHPEKMGTMDLLKAMTGINDE